jgi:hypothetical protein
LTAAAAVVAVFFAPRTSALQCFTYEAKSSPSGRPQVGQGSDGSASAARSSRSIA